MAGGRIRSRTSDRGVMPVQIFDLAARDTGAAPSSRPVPSPPLLSDTQFVRPYFGLIRESLSVNP
jgi:hypothetical protein